MAGIEIEQEFLRDGIVDVAGGAGVGVNGLDITKCQIGAGTIALEVDTRFPWPREPIIVFRNIPSSRRYALTVNGVVLGTYDAAQLEKGIATALPKERRP
jgi:hypothetical protein